MTADVLGLEEIDRSSVDAVGGKGAHLGELSRIEGVRVPDGFCVTTHAFQRVVGAAPSLNDPLERLSRLEGDDQEAIRVVSAEIRRTIEGLAIPDDLAAAIAGAHARVGDLAAYAVRSSATAEDLPTASFAGQQDTYLNVVGLEAVLSHVRRCWASLFTERAVTYRLRSRFDHREAQLAVVVQRMVFPDAAGVMFTADPTHGDRKVISVEAIFGLGEALVSGLVNADAYKVRDGAIVSKVIGNKQLAIAPSATGGTEQRALPPERRAQPTLTDLQVLRLARLGRKIEAHFGRPQDIEWCLVDDELHVVQSRPITTLFPIPPAIDGQNRVYVSVGHQQMMTDAMRPLGLSMWQLMAGRTMHEAGGRLFVDVTQALATPAGRAGLLGGLGKSDPLIGDALRTLLDRGDFIAPLPDLPAGSAAVDVPTPAPIETDPAIVAGLIKRFEAALEASLCGLRASRGSALLDVILTDIKALRQLLFDPTSMQVIFGGIEAAYWLNDRMHEWLGEKNAADTLTQSVPGNVTSEMGLALLDVADVVRRHAEVVAFLEQVENDDDLDELPRLVGGQEAEDAIRGWLDKYGMRGVGEIDITRPRFRERPIMLVPLILGNIRIFEPGAGERRFEQGRQNAWRQEQDLLERLRATPDGERKADETRRMIDRVRTFAGYREYPKYGMVCRTFGYKQALLEEAERLVLAGVLRERDDVFFLRFEELQEVVRTNHVDQHLIDDRKAAFRSYQTLKPPRVLTSDGEAISGTYRRDDLPPGALVGLGVSAGSIEGRARVILDIARASLDADDILVTVFTDPSWTPLFVAIKGVVTEVGGLMTHGAVIAREYGLPAVVGVENATTLIKDGQRIRVNGTNGTVEVL